MKLPTFFGKQRKLRPLLLRQIVGTSMLPVLREGGVLVASGWFKKLRPHDIIIIHHQGREKVKRVQAVDGDKLFVVGDNAPQSTDSRHFGWLPLATVRAKVIWPKIEPPDEDA
jgi:phage repressor protein C with HTH and peptisase S24 domain